MRAKAHAVGFTLIEMIVVITIMAGVAALVLVRQPMRSAGLDSEACVTALTHALQLARSRAIAQDRTVAVVTTATGFVIDGGAPWRLPANATLSPTQVSFTPDGGSSGATILLTAGARRTQVSVNWLTGRTRRADSSAAAE